MTFTDAIELGNIGELERLRDAGLLPDLMDTPDPLEVAWYPHEIAIKWGQFEVLKWLVNESGQRVDLTAQQCRSVVAAAAYERTEILRWLILESGQDVDPHLDSDDTEWYKSQTYNNYEITNLLESLDRLLSSNISISTIRVYPEILDDVTQFRATEPKRARRQI